MNKEAVLSCGFNRDGIDQYIQDRRVLSTDRVLEDLEEVFNGLTQLQFSKSLNLIVIGASRNPHEVPADDSLELLISPTNLLASLLYGKDEELEFDDESVGLMRELMIRLSADMCLLLERDYTLQDIPFYDQTPWRDPNISFPWEL